MTNVEGLQQAMLEYQQREAERRRQTACLCCGKSSDGRRFCMDCRLFVKDEFEPWFGTEFGVFRSVTGPTK